jgi:thioredoxin-related protein
MLKLLIAACLMVVSLFAAPIQNDKEFQQVVEKMGKEEKLVLMIYTADDCPECAYMKQTALLKAFKNAFAENSF